MSIRDRAIAWRFFCQANKDVEILGPQAKYPPITAEAYLQQRIQANFAKG
ncbi:Uncharacterised protein [Raoultella ornithinolytica]|nr:Uncharacterised protein [Raoultella ornithinolytica]